MDIRMIKGVNLGEHRRVNLGERRSFLKRGFRRFRIKPVGPSGRGGQYYDESALRFLELLADEYIEAVRRLAKHNESAGSPAFETLTASLLAHLSPSTAEPDWDSGPANWTFMLYEGDLYAHPRAHDIEPLRLSHGEKPTPEFVANAIGAVGETSPISDGLRLRRSQLFRPCKGCNSPERCAAMPPNPMPWTDGENKHPLCHFRDVLLMKLRVLIAEEPEVLAHCTVPDWSYL